VVTITITTMHQTSKHLSLWGLMVLALTLVASGAPQSLSIDLDGVGDPSVTGQGWTSCGESCSGYCADTEHAYYSSAWEDGYYFDSEFEGSARCTLTVKATAFSTSGSQISQNQEWVQGSVNGVTFDHTNDICTNDASCGCDIATETDTRTVPFYLTDNHITVRRGWDSVSIKGASLDCVEICDDEDLDEYQCQGWTRQQLHQSSDCSTDWQDREYCEYGCIDGICNDGCEAGYTGNVTCDGNQILEEYLNYDCTRTWRLGDYCVYGCFNGSCTDDEPFCEDTDGGIVYDERGTTYGLNDAFVSYSKLDYCTGKILYEYYCDGNDWAVVDEECDEACRDGRCVDSCEDDCEWGERECDGNDVQICGYFDDDVCLDWDEIECDGDCEDGYCVDGCDPHYENSYRCYGAWSQRIYIDEECDDSWVDWEYCEAGCTNGRCRNNYCGDNVCNNGETCLNCEQDCGRCDTCGDGYCNYGETCNTCEEDCGSCPGCGDGYCSASEDCLICEEDCGECDTCGDGVCSADEDCLLCQEDCGICDDCGDGYCTGEESCDTCSSDCGECLTPCGIPLTENVEVTAQACIVYTGDWTDSFNITIYNRNDNSAVFQIKLSGEAKNWADTQSPSIRIPEYGSGKFLITVEVPEGTEIGSYNLTAEIKMEGELIASRDLSVNVVEPAEEGGEPTVTIGDEDLGPSGAFVSGEIDWLLSFIILAIIINVILLAVLLNKRS
jgi:hypothetical protein